MYSGLFTSVMKQLFSKKKDTMEFSLNRIPIVQITDSIQVEDEWMSVVLFKSNKNDTKTGISLEGHIPLHHLNKISRKYM
jgi:predicted RNA-binding protein with PUA domain